MNAFEFAKQVIELCSGRPFIRGVEVLLLDEPVAKIKSVIDDKTHISVFFNADTARHSFVLIKNDRRIFGADNVGGWHIHPFEDPESHQDSDEITFAGFLDMVGKGMDR
jgi:hypothetical protein